MRIDHFDLMALDLPFKRAFRHAAAERTHSDSLLLRCVTQDGGVGYGEALPRHYVTGESRDGAFAYLADRVLPRLLGRDFAEPAAVFDFLSRADGQAPADCGGAPDLPFAAAWCAVDLALLDAAHREAGTPLRLPPLHVHHPSAGPDAPDPTAAAAGNGRHGHLDRPAYSAVATADSSWHAAWTLLKMRLYGFREVKLKVSDDAPLRTCRRARRLLGDACDLRVDVNMGWHADAAPDTIRQLRDLNIRVFEQPVPAAEMPALAQRLDLHGVVIMADEAASDRASITRLAETGACNGVNVRISKCGGLVGALNRCSQVLSLNWLLQIGCHVGETSLLAAAQLALLHACPQARYAEGCFGAHLLAVDPFRPRLQFGYAGRRPPRPTRPGLGVDLDDAALSPWVSTRTRIG